MAFNNVKQQGKKQDMPFQKHNTSRGGGKKWNNAGASGSQSNSFQGNGSNTTSGNSSPVSPAPSSPSIADSRPNSVASSEMDTGSQHMHDRMLFLLANLVGLNVQVKTKDGAEIEGLFHAATTSSDLAIVLKLARKIQTSDEGTAQGDNKTNPNPAVATMIIQAKDLVQVSAINVDFEATTKPVAEKDTFKTDVDISGRGSEIRERQLHRWNPDAHTNEEIGGLEDSDTFGETKSDNWDQFAANEKLFGLKTNFDEELYTTKLDRSAPDFKAREKRAAEMAAEIQRSASTNVHMMEERGLQMDDSGMDEEDRYGAVVRDANSNKYMPPALRKQFELLQGGKPDSGNESSTAKNGTKPDSKKSRGDSPLQKLSTTNLPKAVVTAPSPVSNLGNLRPETAALLGKVPVGGKIADDGKGRKPIETEIAHTFRQFAMVEKDKLNAKKQALQKKEKDGRLADLMKFHQTFKLNVPVPPDLVPLLSKTKKSPTSDSEETPKSEEKAIDASKQVGESKQKQPTETAEINTEPAAKAADTPATSSAPAAKVATPASKPATEAKPAAKSTSSFKFNVKASEFKPNPSAPAFVPGGASKAMTEATGAKKQHQQVNNLTLTEAFVPPSAKDKQVKPDCVGPTWPYGNKSYRHQFHQYSGYEEDMYQNTSPQNYPYNYPYRYAQYVPGMAPVPVQQPGMPYMNPQFVAQNMPYNTGAMSSSGGPSFSPQMTNVPAHGQPYPQVFNSPQRSPMIPQGMSPHQVYQYPGGPRGGPMMMRYPPEMVSPNMSPTPVMMQPGQPHSTPPLMHPQAAPIPRPSARRPVTPNVATPTSTYRPFSERKPRRSGVKGSPLRMIRTPPANHSEDEQRSMTFFDLPTTPLTSKTLAHSTSQYDTPMADKTAQSNNHDLEIPLSPFLSKDLVTSSTPNKQTTMPELPARATFMSTSRQQFVDREAQENDVESEQVNQGTKRLNDDNNDHHQTSRVWDDQNKEFRPVIDNIKRRISTIVFKCTNRDISTPLRRRSLISDLRRRSEDTVDEEDEDAKAALNMLKDAIKEAKQHESMILEESPIEVEEDNTQVPSPDIPPSTQPREVVRGTDTSMYMKSPPITTDGERRYITVYLPREPKIPQRNSNRSVMRSPNASFSSLRATNAESENPFEVDHYERESWEKGLHRVAAGTTSARLASLNERLRRAESAEASKKSNSSDRPKSPYLPIKPTIAHGPSLETSKRVKNSNTEERELEEARKNQFKAHPVNKRVLESRGHLGVPEAKASRVTTAHSPVFHTLSRHSH
ncbi:unnamed protein product [Umbelopsis vinacea]